MVVLSSEIEHWESLCVCSYVHVFCLLGGGNGDKNSLIIR